MSDALRIDIHTADAVAAVNKAVSALDALKREAYAAAGSAGAVARFKKELEALDKWGKNENVAKYLKAAHTQLTALTTAKGAYTKALNKAKAAGDATGDSTEAVAVAYEKMHKQLKAMERAMASLQAAQAKAIVNKARLADAADTSAAALKREAVAATSAATAVAAGSDSQMRALGLWRGNLRQVTAQAQKELAGHYDALGFFISKSQAALAAKTATFHSQVFGLGRDTVRQVTAQAQREVAGHYNSLGVFISNAQATLAAKSVADSATFHSQVFGLGRDTVRQVTAQAQREVAGHYSSLGVFISNAQAALAAKSAADSATFHSQVFGLGRDTVRQVAAQAQREAAGHYNSLGVFISNAQAALAAKSEANKATQLKALGLGSDVIRQATAQAQRDIAGHYDALGVFISSGQAEAAAKAAAGSAAFNSRVFGLGRDTVRQATAQAKGEVTGHYNALGLFISKEQAALSAQMVAESKRLSQNRIAAMMADAVDERSALYQKYNPDTRKAGALVRPLKSAEATMNPELAAAQRHYAELSRIASISAEDLQKYRAQGITLNSSDRQRLADHLRIDRANKKALADSTVDAHKVERARLQAHYNELHRTTQIGEQELLRLRKMGVSLMPTDRLRVADYVEAQRPSRRTAAPDANLPKAGVLAATAAGFGTLTDRIWDSHSAVRGLASGFGLLYLTWGATLPLLAGAAISFGVAKTLQAGKDLTIVLADIQYLAGTSAADMDALHTSLMDVANGAAGPQKVAEALRYMTLAGVSTAQAMTAVGTVLNLANLSNMDVGQAAESLIAVGTAFGYTASGLEHVADVIASVAAASMADISDMTQAFRLSSVVAEQFGASIEDVAVSLGLLSQIGIKGSAAGTALRQSYVELAGSSKQAIKTLKALDIKVFDDALGRVRPRMEVIADIAKKLSTMPISEQFRLLDKFSNERGLKSISTDMKALLRQWQAQAAAIGNVGDEATYVKDKLTELQDAVANAEGFTALLAIGKNTAFGKQWEAAAADFQRAMGTAFQQTEDYASRFMVAVRQMFQSDELRGALTGLLETVLRLGRALVEHIDIVVGLGKAALVLVTTYYAANVALWASAKAGAAAAVSYRAMTMGLAGVGPVAASAALGLTMLNRALGVVALLLAAGAVAWAFFADKSESAIDRASEAAKTHSDMVNMGLDEQILRLKKEAEERKKGTDSVIFSAAVSRELLISEIENKYAAVTATQALAAEEKKLALQRLKEAQAKPSLMDKLLQGPAAAFRQDLKDKQLRDAEEALAEAETALVKSDLERRTELTRVRNKAAELLNLLRDKKDETKPTATTGGQTGTLEGLDPTRAAAFTSKIKEQNDIELQMLRDKLKRNLEILNDFYDAGELAAGKYQAAVARSNAEGTDAVLRRLTTNKDALLEELGEFALAQLNKDGTDQTALGELVAKERTEIELKYLREVTEARNDATETERKIWVKQSKDLIAIRDKTAEAIAASQDRVRDLQDERRDEVALYDLGPAEAAALQARMKVEKDRAKTIRQLNEEISTEQRTLNEIDAALNTELSASAEQAMFQRWLESHQRMQALKKGGIDLTQQYQIEADAAAASAAERVRQESMLKMRNDLTDAIVTALTDGGKAGGAKLRSMLEAKLLEPLTIFINGIITPIVQGAYGMMGIGGGAGGAAGGGGLGGTLRDALSLNNASALGGLFSSSAAYGAALGTTSIGAGSQAAMLAAQTGEFGAAGLAATGAAAGGTAGAATAGLASVAGPVALAYAATQLSKAIAGGYRLGGLPPELGGGLARLFGRKLQDSGMRGEFSGNSFSGETYKFYKGGLLRSNKTTTEAMDEDMTASLSTQFKALKAANVGMASALGMSTDAISAYTASINISTKGLTEQEIGQKLAEEFTKMGDGMAALAPGLTIYRRAGESASETLTRMYGYYVNEKQAEIAILNAQGKRIQALNMQRDLEVALLDDVEKASKKRIYALEDEVYAATELAGIQKEVDGLTLTAIQLRAKEREALVDANKALFDYVTALQNVDELEDKLVDALDNLVSQLEQVADDFAGIVKSLTTYRTALDTGEAAQLSPQDKYLTTKAALEANQIKALTGDKDALSAVEDLSTKFLDASKEYYATGTAYFSDLDMVKGMVSAAITTAQAQETAALQAKSDAEKQLEALGQVKTAVDSVEDATRAVQAAVIQLAGATAMETYTKLVSSGTAPSAAYSQAASVVTSSAIPEIDKQSTLASLKTAATTEMMGRAETAAASGSWWVDLALFRDVKGATNLDKTDPTKLAEALRTWQQAMLTSYDYEIADITRSLNSIREYASPEAVASYQSMLDGSKTNRDAMAALKFAKGGAFTNGIVSRPTMFNMGQMGEAGSEAIMPLSRMPNGSLGVAAMAANNDELVAELRALRAEVAELKQHAAANVRVAQAVGKAQIEQLETIADSTSDAAKTQRLAELAR